MHNLELDTRGEDKDRDRNEKSEISKNPSQNKSKDHLNKSKTSLKSEMRDTKDKLVNEKVTPEIIVHDSEDFSQELMREILTINDEDIVRIIGKKFVTEKRVSA